MPQTAEDRERAMIATLARIEQKLDDHIAAEEPMLRQFRELDSRVSSLERARAWLTGVGAMVVFIIGLLKLPFTNNH